MLDSLSTVAVGVCVPKWLGGAKLVVVMTMAGGSWDQCLMMPGACIWAWCDSWTQYMVVAMQLASRLVQLGAACNGFLGCRLGAVQ